MNGAHLATEVVLRIALFAVYVWTDLQEPFLRVIQKEEWWLYNNPYTDAADVTITTTQLFWIVIFVPTVIFSFFGIISRQVGETITATLGLSMSLLLNGIITNGIKLMVGRPRPDFYMRCFPDGKESFEGLNPICSGDDDVIIEGRKSFPSGHSSWSFAGLLFLSYYLAGKLQCFSAPPPKSLFNFVVALCPSLMALFIALSRYCDYWHHYQDVVFGSLIGAIIATISYFYYYPSLWHTLSHRPIGLGSKDREVVRDSKDKFEMIKIM